MPKTVCATSLRPEPISPARPTISPARTVKLTPRTTGGETRSRTSSTGAPGWVANLGNRWSMTRPTIIVISSGSLVSATALVATYSPSRSTVTRSARAKISAMRWLM